MRSTVVIIGLILLTASLTAVVGCAQNSLSNATVQDPTDLITYERESGMPKSPDSKDGKAEAHSKAAEVPAEQSKTEEPKENTDSQKIATERYEQEKQALPLIVKLEEVNRDIFIEQFGRDAILSDPATATADRIAEIDINPELIEPSYLSHLDMINLTVFDDKCYRVLFDTINIYGQSISSRGKIVDSATAVFFLSVTGKQVLASLRLPDSNNLITIKYIQPAGKHYLFQADITEIEQYECEVRIPQD